MPSWIGGWEIAIVLVLVLVIFGPKKLPELGSSLGKSIRGFRKGLKESKDEVKSTVSEVRDAVGVNEVKSTVAEVRDAVGVKDMKDALSLKTEATEPAPGPDTTTKAE
jgi:sec-independent protein translocase protein TatA